MIKSVTVKNYVGDSLVLDLRRPEQSGLLIESIDGLGPGKATINYSEYATIDGGMYNSSRRPTRNIVIALKFLDKPTIEDSRLLTYRYFPIKRNITLYIETDVRTYQINGYVESNEPEIFSNFSGTSISIICTDPHFYDFAGSEDLIFSKFIPGFEFPFSNESLTEKLLAFGEITDKTIREIRYSGDDETGLTIIIEVASGFTNYKIENQTTRKYIELDAGMLYKVYESLGDSFKDGDIIKIVTEIGKKKIDLFRDGKTYNIFKTFSPGSSWIQLVPGSNIIHYNAVDLNQDENIEDVRTILKYSTSYLGV